MTPIYFSMVQDSFLFDNRLEVIPLSWRPVPHICLQSSKLALMKSNTFLCVEVASSCPHPCPEFLISTFTLTFLVWSLESCFHNSLYIFKSTIVELQISTFSAASFLTWSNFVPGSGSRSWWECSSWSRSTLWSSAGSASASTCCCSRGRSSTPSVNRKIF